MRAARKLPRMFAVIAIAIAVVACFGAAARAASPPGWKIVASFPRGTVVQSLAVGGPHNAWANVGSGLRQWNGTVWQSRPMPPAPIGYSSVGVTQVAAGPGSTDAWAIVAIGAGWSETGAVVRWTGKTWTPVFSPAGVMLTNIIEEGSNVWVFGGITGPPPSYTYTPYMAHYNGTTWQTTPASGFRVDSVAARSASDIYVLGSGPGDLVISHWNGTRWSTSKLPAGDGVPAQVGRDEITSGPHDVWVYGYLNQKSGNAQLLHLHNGRWTKITIPHQATANADVGSIESDGAGGVWVAFQVVGADDYTYHDSAAGHWSAVPIPAPKGTTDPQIWGFAQIPGSTSVYAYGLANVISGPGVNAGIILKS